MAVTGGVGWGVAMGLEIGISQAGGKTKCEYIFRYHHNRGLCGFPSQRMHRPPPTHQIDQQRWDLFGALYDDDDAIGSGKEYSSRGPVGEREYIGKHRN